MTLPELPPSDGEDWIVYMTDELAVSHQPTSDRITELLRLGRKTDLTSIDLPD